MKVSYLLKILSDLSDQDYPLVFSYRGEEVSLDKILSINEAIYINFKEFEAEPEPIIPKSVRLVKTKRG